MIECVPGLEWDNECDAPPEAVSTLTGSVSVPEFAMQSWFIPPIIVPVAMAIMIVAYGLYRASAMGIPF